LMIGLCGFFFAQANDDDGGGICSTDADCENNGECLETGICDCDEKYAGEFCDLPFPLTRQKKKFSGSYHTICICRSMGSG